MNAEILSVGTELLLGGTVNTDARDISLALAELGVNVYWHTVVGDNPARLTECLYRARNRADLIIVDEFAYPLMENHPSYAALFYAFISSRYEKKSTIITTNRSVTGLAQVFGQ